MVSEDRRRPLTVRAALLPFRVVAAAVTTGFRMGWWTARMPARVTVRTGRLVGLRALVLFVAGIAIGLLFAPGPGRDLRARLRRRAEAAVVSDSELSDKVAFELAHAPRTWHLPQPEVSVAAGRVELRGAVPHERGREELVRVAASVAGVDQVEDNLSIDEALATPAG